MLALLAGVLLVVGADRAERAFLPPHRTEAVTDAVEVPGRPADVWSEVLAVDAIRGRKPLLLQIGLPVPLYCELEGKGVGARRVCHFERGVIEERVTAWEPPRRLALEIMRVTLPSHEWLGFADATYRLRPAGAGRTRVSRTTTLTSTLRPGWYWRWFEHLGVRAEHRYLLRSLQGEGLAVQP